MKGLFIPDITAEMFRNGCLEGIEALMAEGEIYDIDYTEWIPVSEQLPEQTGEYLVWAKWPCDEFATHSILHYDADVEGFGEWEEYYHPDTLGYLDSDFKEYAIEITAWRPLPKPYKAESKIKQALAYADQDTLMPAT